MKKVLVLLFQLCLVSQPIVCAASEADHFLSKADQELGDGSYERAIQLYTSGIEALEESESLVTILSLETNLASALSALGQNEEAVEHYRKAILSYKETIDGIDDQETVAFAKEITTAASFYLGMVYQDMDQPESAVQAYGHTFKLDENHWASLANLGSVLHDQMKMHDDALDAYNKAYLILTSDKATDPPEEPKPILSQLQYRIGLCLSHNFDRKCAISDDPNEEVSCKEMATHAFSMAVQFDPENASAKHMLSTITADATMTRASNDYVKNLFDDYARK